jgi:hypothetical protein
MPLQALGLALAFLLAFPSRFLAYAPEAAVSRMKIFLIKTLLRGNPVLRENPP